MFTGDNFIHLILLVAFGWAFSVFNKRWQDLYQERSRRIEAAIMAMAELTIEARGISKDAKSNIR